MKVRSLCEKAAKDIEYPWPRCSCAGRIAAPTELVQVHLTVMPYEKLLEAEMHCAIASLLDILLQQLEVLSRCSWLGGVLVSFCYSLGRRLKIARFRDVEQPDHTSRAPTRSKGVVLYYPQPPYRTSFVWSYIEGFLSPTNNMKALLVQRCFRYSFVSILCILDPAISSWVL